MSENAIASRRRSTASRLLSSIRFDEVMVLQGAPVIGACFAIGILTPHKIIEVAALIIGSVSLVAHVYVFNDWAGVAGDLRDPNRAARTFIANGVTRTEVGILAALLLAASLLVSGLLGVRPFLLTLAMTGASVLYSAPALHLKGLPFFGSVLHFVGETLHFLLGYATFSAIDERGILIGCFFGLVYAAGHLMHEVRGRDGDVINGFRTNAVAFGKERTFVAGAALFTVAYTLMTALAAFGVLPRVLFIAAALYPVHVIASLRAWRAGLDLQSLIQLQKCYRLLYAAIGIVLIVATLLS